MPLHNRYNAEALRQALSQSQESRVTVSFYRYHPIADPQAFRDELYAAWDELGVLGRTYVAQEGINAQISVPAITFDAFKQQLYAIDWLDGVRLNVAVEDDGKSFFKLTIKVRPKIVADGLDDQSFDPSDTGIHLDAERFNQLTDREDVVIVDMRNHYESEVGHFEGAITPDVDTFRDSLPTVEEILAPHRDKHIVMYCTGGIRCEKASAYFKHQGFQNVYQLEGGIIKYARDVQAKGLPNKFRGKNFVFDERLGERISHEVIAHCHQCGAPCDTHVNCRNDMCNLLFIQCEACARQHEGCCSEACQEIVQLPAEVQREMRRGQAHQIHTFSKGRFKSSVPSSS
jgi:UPF0176 protein